MAPAQTFDPAKFRELLLYVARRSEDDPTFGATKLNKILFFADFLAYGMRGRSITGATYQRLPRGPAPRELLPQQRALTQAGDAIVSEGMRFNFPQKRLTAIREPDKSVFEDEELEIVEQLLVALRNHNASEVSALSHYEVRGWQLVDDYEDIPYTTVFLSTDPPTEVDRKRAEELVLEHGWVGNR